MGSAQGTINKTYSDIPRYHFKCRYDKSDEFCEKTEFYTRTNDIKVKSTLILCQLN